MLLKFPWVSFERSQSIIIKVDNVFKAVDLAQVPEYIVSVFALPFYLEVLHEVGVNFSFFLDSSEHLSLSKRTTGVEIKVILNIVLGVSLNMLVENSELADQVLVGQVWVRFFVLTSISPVLVVKSGETPCLQLIGNVVTCEEATKSDWDLHPSFSE